MKTQTEFGGRVEQSMNYAGFTQKELADKVTDLLNKNDKISQQAIQYLIKKGKSSTFTTQIANACQVSSSWLATGNGSMLIQDNIDLDQEFLKPNSGKLDNLEYIINTDSHHKKNNNNNKPPLYSYDEVREMMTEYNSESPEPHQIKSKLTNTYFRMKVSGDSMLAPAGSLDTFPQGTQITIDTSNKTPKEGDFITSMVKDTQAINFRQYRTSEGKPFLHALNADYKPIFDNFEIIGIITHSILEKKY